MPSTMTEPRTSGRDVFEHVKEIIAESPRWAFNETVAWACREAQHLDEVLDERYVGARFDIKQFQAIAPSLSEGSRPAISFWATWCNTLHIEISRGLPLQPDMISILHSTFRAVQLLGIHPK